MATSIPYRHLDMDIQLGYFSLPSVYSVQIVSVCGGREQNPLSNSPGPCVHRYRALSGEFPFFCDPSQKLLDVFVCLIKLSRSITACNVEGVCLDLPTSSLGLNPIGIDIKEF